MFFLKVMDYQSNPSNMSECANGSGKITSENSDRYRFTILATRNFPLGYLFTVLVRLVLYKNVDAQGLPAGLTTWIDDLHRVDRRMSKAELLILQISKG